MYDIDKYKTGEVADIIGVHIRTLQKWDNDGFFKAKRTITGRRYYLSSDIDKLTEVILNKYR